MAQFFRRGATPPGGRDGTAFNNSQNFAQAAPRIAATPREQKFVPDPKSAPTQGILATPPGGLALDNNVVKKGARPVVPGQGTQAKHVSNEPQRPLPPGLRPQAAAARMPGPQGAGEFGEVVLGGRPIGPRTMSSSHAAPAKPLAMDLGSRAPTHLPPSGRRY